MIVSNFALGFNSSATFPQGWTAGYELLITNLYNIKVDFDLECRITDIELLEKPGETTIRALGALLSYDWHKDANGYYHQSTITLDPGAAQAWNLGPWIFDDPARGTPYLKGYTLLRVPVVRSLKAPYGLVPQAVTPIPVLLDATRIDNSTTLQSDIITAARSPYALATGKAYNEIAPETHPYEHPIFIARYLTALKQVDLKIAPSKGAIGLAEEDRAQALIDLLGQASGTKEDIDELNNMLSELGCQIRVTAAQPDS